MLEETIIIDDIVNKKKMLPTQPLALPTVTAPVELPQT